MLPHIVRSLLGPWWPPPKVRPPPAPAHNLESQAAFALFPLRFMVVSLGCIPCIGTEQMYTHWADWPRHRHRHRSCVYKTHGRDVN